MATINLCLDRSGNQVDGVTLESQPEAVDERVALVWIDVDAADKIELARLQRQFGLHALAIEDAISRHQRAKYRLYDDMLYLEFYGLALIDDEIDAHEVSIFAGERFLITVRHDDKPDLDGILQRWNDQDVDTLAARLGGAPTDAGSHVHGLLHHPSPIRLVYTILDELVDGYFAPVEWLGDEIERLEDAILAADGVTHQVSINRLRSRIFLIRRLLAPEQEALNMLLRRDVPLVDDALIPYFADIHDHLLRIQDWTESFRDQLSSIADMQLGLQSHRLDRTLRTLTAWSIILMTCALIAGIYGMNFRHMPELGWRPGYPLALALMVLASASLALAFKRRGWW